MAHKLNISSFNTRGLGDKIKRHSIFNYVKTNFKGIIFMQETHSSVKTENEWKREFNGKIYFAHGTTGARGVAILIPSHIKTIIHNIEVGPNGRLLLLDITINDIDYALLNVYAPTKDHTTDQNEFSSQLLEMLLKYSDKNIIVGGDLNTVLDPNIDKCGGKVEKLSNYAKSLMDIMDTLDLTDIWRIRNPDSKRYTHRQKTKAGIVHSRIDFFLTSTSLTYNILETNICAGLQSDHSIIQICVSDSETITRGKGLWKFNTSLLTDINYANNVRSIISETFGENTHLEDKGILWELIKCKIRGMTISYSSYKAKEKHKYEDELKVKLDTLDASVLNENTFEEYDSLKREYEQIQREKAQGAMIRSRAKFIEDGEKCTKFFLNLEKKNHELKNIRCLLCEDDSILTEPEAILEKQKEYYENLYTEPSESASIEPNAYFLDNANIQQLDDTSKLDCEKDITLEECSMALKSMANNKTPGADGFPTEFYKFFWQDIKNIVFSTYKYAFLNDKLSVEQRRGVLTLIPKKDSDLRMLKSWRPLTLLNTDYKILTKVLANRLQNVADEIVSHDQSGYIKNRYIGENLRTISDIIEYCTLFNKTGILTLIDCEKAFDTIKWSFLHNTLLAMNFGNNFCKWIKIIYTDICSCCMNNGHTSRYFKPSRGIRQGCPVSALLFVLVAEILATHLRTNANISGISISNTEFIVSQLADDTSLFLNNESSLEAAIDLLTSFSKVSGLKLNKAKTQIFYLGNTNHRPDDRTHGIDGITNNFKSLGIYFCKDQKDMVNKNLEEKYKKFKNILNMWSQRDLSLKGKS